MKLLDPFAGYRLASGHPFFHIALFVCSFFVGVFGGSNTHSVDALVNCFYALRWAHFVLFTLSLIEAYCNRPSAVPEKKTESETQEELEIEQLKIYHRDGSWKLFARICSTISVFAYQGTVFYAQLCLASHLLVMTADG